jgi:hypothetical protein
VTVTLSTICTECWAERRKAYASYRGLVMDTKSIQPTMDEINALPRKVKRYIQDLEMRINQNGQALTVTQLREERDLLHRRVEELEARIALQEREYLEAPIETD